ncbi:MAG: transcriptional regulator [Chlorobiaceae bacterium]|nr:transcriptional regulator [Chlorobiaceae bacterium]
MKNSIIIRFGKRVRQERTKRDLSQEQLAELANVHRTYVGMVERGEKNITLFNIERIAKALKISVSELLS